MQHDDHTRLFMQHRPVLRRLAYRMLSCVSLAEDAVQETWLRWHSADVTQIESAKAWLITTLSRICIDELRRLKREQSVYVGPWLPEPIFTEDEAPDPADILARDASIAMALLVLMERLSPEERAAYLLQEVFENDYKSIAVTLGKAEANCRQLVHRARVRIEEGKTRFTAPTQLKNELLAKFASACLSGDLSALIATLAPDVNLVSDGGGVVKAANKPVYGVRAVSRLVMGIRKTIGTGYYALLKRINDEFGIVGYAPDGRIEYAMTFALSEQGVTSIFVVNNPAKLRQLDSGWLGPS
ncbi:MAG TPA: RNA polymerase sigma factor SigJ [Dongiaceae bacterium]|nr:RNA polymerase sigma factor SigJ [Dongiaceae bacterium]